MKNYSTIQQLALGLGLSLLGILLLTTLPLVVHFQLAFSITLIVLTFLYSVLILKKSQTKIGQVSLLFSFIACSAALLVFDASIYWFIFSALVMIWVTRLIFSQSSLFNACYSAILLGGGITAACAVLVTTRSWFLAFWCFFLIQILFSCAPNLFTRKVTQTSAQSEQSFKNAFQSANKALENLSKL